MALILPVNSEPDRRMQIRLGEFLLSVRTYWNDVAQRWYMDLFDADGASLARGLCCVPGVNLLEAETELTRVYGQFRVSVSDGGENATVAEWGSTSLLWWFAPGEYEAIDASRPYDTSSTLPFDVRQMYSPVPRTDPAPPWVELDRWATLIDVASSRLYKIVNTDFYPRLS